MLLMLSTCLPTFRRLSTETHPIPASERQSIIISRRLTAARKLQTSSRLAVWLVGLSKQVLQSATASSLLLASHSSKMLALTHQLASKYTERLSVIWLNHR